VLRSAWRHVRAEPTQILLAHLAKLVINENVSSALYNHALHFCIAAGVFVD
jgi:hypothetical protein